MDIEKLLKVIPKENIYINEPMSKHTTFKIGGPADCFVKAKNLEQIECVLNLCKEQNLPLTVIGNGSNVLVKDNGIRGIVLKINMDDYSIKSEGNDVIVDVEAGMLNAKLAHVLLQEGIKGFEFASGIPGTIGGAIKMNAGAYGFEIKDIILETTYIDIETSEVKTANKDEMDFSYRHSIFSDKKAIILSAKFKFKYGNKEEIEKKMQENLNSRKEKQPIEKPSAGSTFKRGEDFITAKLIDECGLKGRKIGGAEVSSKHAGFIINSGNASAKDVIDLVNLVKNEVKKQTGKEISLEIEIIGQ